MTTYPLHLSLQASCSAKLATGCLAPLMEQRARANAWAWSAAVRLSDQNKPMLLKLLVEAAILMNLLGRLLFKVSPGQSVEPAKKSARRPATMPGHLPALGGKRREASALQRRGAPRGARRASETPHSLGAGVIACTPRSGSGIPGMGDCHARR